ncbi:MAG: Na/Pi cotransporter family protein [Lachnospiraceae bacterium]|nr:Na/Pi cotransporter family protein [Lachnospiraceae bacterium]MDY4070305.1 Na/Pi cotransporter family protein [Lachnospiraceae bacterium]
MTINDLGMIFEFIGGLGLFLYGMNIMADGLQRSAGGKLKDLMGFLTRNRFVAVLMGAGITALIQSSSATTVMVVGFVNAGMLSLSQAVGVIMGANVGTTITAWIVSLNEWGSVLKPEFFAPLVVGVGAIMFLFAKSERKKKIGEIMAGFGILFIGLSFMSGSIAPYKDAPVFSEAFRVLGRNPILAVVAGAVVTAIIQSSSASVGILQTLAMNGIVNWQSAVFITLGQNIGTCVTAILSSTGTGKNAKRASVIHLLFNMIGSIWFGIVMFIIFRFQNDWASATINSVQISIFHTVFNVLNTLVLFPFGDVLVKLSIRLIPDSPEQNVAEDTIESQVARRLDRRILNNPTFAIETAIGEVLYMGEITRQNLVLAIEAVAENSKEKIQQVFRTEETVNQLEKLLTSFLVEVDNLSLTEAQHLKIKNLFYTVSDIERIGDHSENIAELADSKRKDKIQFSEKGNRDLEKIYTAAVKTLDASLEARRQGSLVSVQHAQEAEKTVDKMEKELRDKHIQRLSKGKCAPESGVIFLDILSNLERIADHADNIAEYVSSEVG